MVLLTSKYAFKIPSMVYGWRLFVTGLLANIQEKQWSGRKGLCPVIWSLPGGFLNVMPRCEWLTDGEYCKEVPEKWGRHLPVEHKTCSFGRLNGKIVAVDYGGFCTINVQHRCEKCKAKA